MFGREIEMLFDTVQQWALDDLDSKIEDAKRKLNNLRKQKKLIAKVVARYRAAEEKQKKAQRDWEKKQRAAMKKMPKFPTYPVGGPLTVAAAVGGKKAG